MLAGSPLQPGVRQARRSVQQLVDHRPELDRLSPHEDLDRLGERVQEAGEASDEGLLLGRRAQGKGDRAGTADDRGTLGAEVDQPVRRDAGQRQAEGRGRCAGLLAEERRDRGHPLRCWDQATGAAQVAPGRQEDPVDREPIRSAHGEERRRAGDWDGHGGERHQRDEAPRGEVGGPEQCPGRGKDGELAGGEAGHYAVGLFDLGWDPHPRVLAAHSPAPAAMALTAL